MIELCLLITTIGLITFIIRMNIFLISAFNTRFIRAIKLLNYFINIICYLITLYTIYIITCIIYIDLIILTIIRTTIQCIIKIHWTFFYTIFTIIKQCISKFFIYIILNQVFLLYNIIFTLYIC